MPKIEIDCRINNIYNQYFILEQEQNNQEYITCDEIKSELYKKLIADEDFLYEVDLFGLEPEDIIILYIRYFDEDIKGWILLDTEYLSLYNKEIIKLLIKLSIRTTAQKRLINKYHEMNKKLNKISNSISMNKSEQNNKKNEYIDSKVDISVLISNPLMDKKYNVETKQFEMKELKSMNDFHNITNSIYNAIRSSTKIVTAEFYPLTENYLKKVILDKPRIIHLICKSVYILPDENQKIDKSSNFANLIFEDNNYSLMHAMNKDDLDNIFDIDKVKKNDIIGEDEIKEGEARKELIKNIVLIISTPLSEDVYELVKDYGFKNVMVQHTTIANSEYIADFNKMFYKNIIEQSNEDDIDNPKINDFFENIELKKNIFNYCCCFHRHNSECPLIKNLINELYQNNSINEKDDKTLEKYFPHFSHLRYKCDKCCTRNIFLQHSDLCINKNISTCCNAKEKKQKGKDKINHNINNTFFRDFKDDENNNEIKLGSGLNGFGVIRNIELLPNYESMKLMVGRNKLIYEIYTELIERKNKIINIYNNNKSQSYELNEIADIIIEYFKERIIYYNEENNIDNIFNDKSSESLGLKKNKTFYISNNFKFSDNNSQFGIKDCRSSSFNLELKSESNSKIIRKFYFIIITDEKLLIAPKLDKMIKDLLEEQNISINAVLFITCKEIGQIINQKFKEKYNFKKFELNNIQKEDYKIKFQMEKPKKKNDEFKNFIRQEMSENRNIYNLKVKKESTIIYELLFLFNCLKREEINKKEMQTLYRGDIKSINEKIQGNFIKFKEMIQLKFSQIFENEKYNKLFNESKETYKYEIQNYINEVIDSIIDKLIDEFYSIKKIITDNKIYTLKKKETKGFNLIIELIDNNIVDIEKIINDKINLVKKVLIDKNDKEKDEIEKMYKDLIEIIEKNIKFIKEQFQKPIENEFYTIKETIENELKIILINDFVLEKSKEKIKTDTIYKKINSNKSFDLYYELWENKITNEIKRNILIKFFKFYSNLFPFLRKIKENKENKFLNSFRIINELSDLLKLNQNSKLEIKEEERQKYLLYINKYINKFIQKVTFLKDYFQKSAYNFDKIFTEENIYLCLNNSEVSDTIKEYIDDLSVSYFSCLKIFDIDEQELKRKIKVFENYFKETNNDLLYGKLILMNWLYNYNIEDLDKVDYILNENEDNLCKEEEIEKKLVESIINIKEYKYYLDQLKIIGEAREKEEEQKIDEKSFSNIFENKIKYILYKYKIKNGICKDKDLEELKVDKDDKEKDQENKSLAKNFKKEGYHLSEIKVYLSIAEWYFEKYKKDGDTNIKNFSDEYLYFAFYVASFYNKKNIDEYMKNYIAKPKYLFKKIKKNEDIQVYNDIINKIKILCDLYNYEYKDTNIDYYIYEK